MRFSENLYLQQKNMSARNLMALVTGQKSNHNIENENLLYTRGHVRFFEKSKILRDKVI